MKYLGLIICAAISAGGLIGCVGQRAQINGFSGQPEKRGTHAEIQKAELAALIKSPIRTTVTSRQEPPRMEKDNSVIETLYDSYGNKVESRVFRNHELLKMVVVKTSVDGQKQAFVYGRNGEIKFASPNELDKIMISAAAEIAKSVEILEGRRDLETLARMPPLKVPSNIDSPAQSNFDSPTVNEKTIEPEREFTEKPANAPVKTAQSDDLKTVRADNAAKKLRSSVQALRANRTKSPTPNQSPE